MVTATRRTLETYWTEHPNYVFARVPSDKETDAKWTSCPECGHRGLEAHRLESPRGDTQIDICECGECLAAFRVN
jgi:DNA-directed RNA polymerase subunit M/transcription elongation factor TFIIS